MFLTLALATDSVYILKSLSVYAPYPSLGHCLCIYLENFVSIYVPYLGLGHCLCTVYILKTFPVSMPLTLALATVCVSMAGLSNGVSASESSVLKIRTVFVIYHHQMIVLKLYPSTCQVILVAYLYEQPEKELDTSKEDHRNK
jgi:hypothetical protein